MAWFMPSYGRAHMLEKMLNAPGRWPDEIHLLVNTNDPKLDGYVRQADKHAQLKLTFLPSVTRLADAFRALSHIWPHEAYYGLLNDDMWPTTGGWFRAMEDAADDCYIATPQGGMAYPLCRTAVCLGGGLVRAMGSLVPVPVKHNYSDNLWDQIAADFKLLRPLPEHVVEHRHWTRGSGSPDMTSIRGSGDIQEDEKIYHAWMAGPEKIAMYKRIDAFLNTDPYLQTR